MIAGFLRHLVERLGPHRVHYLHVGDPIEELSGFEDVFVHEMGRPSRVEQAHSIALNAGLQRRSLQETLTWSPTVAVRVQSTLDLLRPDLEVIDTVRMAQHVRGYPPTGRRVLYLDDLFSVRYRRMLDVLERGAGDVDFDPLGQFVTFVPESLRPLAAHPVVRRLLLELELGRIGDSETSVASRADTSVLLNEVEARLLRDATGARVEVVPPSLPGPSAAPELWSGRPDFAFVGLLSIPHNHDALSWFLAETMPRVLARRPDARLHVIGRDPAPQLASRMAAFGDRVVSHGFVPDLDAVLGGVTALVNPLRFGSGVKIKALEAVARGLPVVATTVGAEGIVTGSEPGFVVADDPEVMARSLVELCDPAVRRQAVAGARRLHEARFSEPVVTAAYDRLFGTVPAASSTMHRSLATNASGENSVLAQ